MSDTADLVQVRPRRHRHGARARTESVRRLSKRALQAGTLEYPPDEQELLPLTRGACEPGGWNGERPCPFVSCRYHLALDVHPTRGSIKLNFPDRDLDEIPATCSLDVAEIGGVTLELVAVVMNLTRERVRQCETLALAKLPREVIAQLGGG